MVGLKTRSERHDGFEWVYELRPDGTEALMTKRIWVAGKSRGWSKRAAREAAIGRQLGGSPPRRKKPRKRH